MHSSIASKTLASLVTENFKTAAVFEKYHLDFCCRGKRSLEQACAELKLPTSQIVAELEKVYNSDLKSGDIGFDNMNLSELSDYIVDTHHAYVKKEMPQILAYLQKVASKHGERHPEMLKVFEIFAAIKEEMEHHMQKEEMVLFPRIKEIEKLVNEGSEIRINQNYLQAPVTIMEQEHDHAGELLKEINRLTNNYTPPADACTTYRLSFAALQAFEADLHRHIHLENNILFPKALHLFGIPGQYSLN